MKTCILFVLVLTCPALALAQSDAICPWFTTGSAETMLGGEVTLTAHITGNWDGSCVFMRKTGTMVPTIEILVGKTNTHPCPESSPHLGALGNDAVQCRRAGSPSQARDIIAGRVRDVYFLVSMAAGSADSQNSGGAHWPDSNPASLLERIAEQVTGNLY